MNEQEMMNGHWHLRKEVTLGSIGTLIIIGLGLIVGYADLKSDMTEMKKHMEAPAHHVTERRLDALEKDMATMSASALAIAQRLDEIIRRLERIEDRLNSNSN
jgi:hypothetical protein